MQKPLDMTYFNERRQQLLDEYIQLETRFNKLREKHKIAEYEYKTSYDKEAFLYWVGELISCPIKPERYRGIFDEKQCTSEPCTCHVGRHYYILESIYETQEILSSLRHWLNFQEYKDYNSKLRGRDGHFSEVIGDTIMNKNHIVAIIGSEGIQFGPASEFGDDGTIENLVAK